MDFFVQGAVSVSDADSDYSLIFDPFSKSFVRKEEKVAVIHKSTEFSDFLSTLCIIWEKCERFVEISGGKVIREKTK